MVGATDVIAGNAPVRLAGVAGGLQSTAMQVGGTIGTTVLGAIMAARVDSLLPARWAAAHLPPLSGLMTDVVHSTFISGMSAAFLVAAVVALAGAAIALLARRGHAVDGAAAAT
jgi:hypothetical protein